MNKEDAIYNLVETFRAIYREERDFTSDEMDIFDKYRALTKRLFLVRKSHNINVYDITKKQNWLEYKKPDKADLEKYKDYLIQINEIHKQRDKIEKAFIKNSEELLSQLLVFLIESIQRLSDTIIGPDILALIEVNREKQLRLFSNLPEEGFLQTSKYITDNIDKLANLMSSDEQIEKMVKTYNAEVTDGDNKLSFDLEFKKDGSTTDLDIYN